MSDEELRRENVARSICLAHLGDENTNPVPDVLMPRAWEVQKDYWFRLADAALAHFTPEVRVKYVPANAVST